MRISSSVQVQNDFRKVTDRVNRVAQRAAAEAAQAGATVAAQHASGQGVSLQKWRIDPVRGSMNGWMSGFWAPYWYWFQNYGTLGNRTKPLKQAPRSNRSRAPGTGIKPLYALDAGRRAGVKVMKDAIKRGL